jgi:hypothetical protein
MPQNCSADVTLVIDHIDEVLTTGTDDEIYALKKMFGMVRINGKKIASIQAIVNSSSSVMLSKMPCQDLTSLHQQLV